MERQLGDILDRADKVSHTTGGGPHPARETLDRSLREIKDNVLRMGSLVEEAIRAALQALVDARRRRGPRGHHRATPGSTRCSGP